MLTPFLDPLANEYFFFHGTGWNFIDVLKKSGYDPRVSSLIGMFGGGFYLAENSSKSNQVDLSLTITTLTYSSTYPVQCVMGTLYFLFAHVFAKIKKIYYFL